MNVLTICQKSQGLEHDALVLHGFLREFDEHIVPTHISLPRGTFDLADNSIDATFSFQPDLVIHLQDIFKVTDSFKNAKHVFVPNLEWMTTTTEKVLNTVDAIWHKSKSAVDEMGMGTYVGFTSIDPGVAVTGFDTVGHFKGKATYRLSDKVVNIWKRRQDFRKLMLHMYSNDMAFFSHPGWFSCGNMEMKIGLMQPSQYFQEIKDAGIQICTSVYEGFGHYINECRAMGGVAIAIDAAPMNELVDESCGYLIKPEDTQKILAATAHLVSEEAIEECLERVFSASPEELQEKGRNARKRYEEDYYAFKQNLFEQMISLGFVQQKRRAYG